MEAKIEQKRASSIERKTVFLLLTLALLAVSIAYSSTYVTNNQQGFDNGTYNKTEWNSSESFVGLASNDTLQELPNNKGNDGWVSMAGNILLFHMNEISGNLADASGSGRTGTSYSATYGLTGKLNSAFGFDGQNDYILAGGSDTFASYSIGTVSAWAKPTTSNGFGTVWGYSTVTQEHGGNSNVIVMFYDYGNQRFHVEMPDGSRTCSASVNAWHHVVLTQDSSTARLFVDGAMCNSMGSNNWFGNLQYSGDGKRFRIGTFMKDLNPTGVNWFAGSLDEFAVWNRVLSPEEVMDIFDRQKGNYIDIGTYISEAFDAGTVVNWKSISWASNTSEPGVHALNLSVRSCDDAACSGDSLTYVSDSSPVDLSLNNNRYFQYICAFETDDASHTAHIYNVSIGYGPASVAPNATSFTPNIETTNFTGLSDYAHVYGLALANINGKIRFPGAYAVNADNQNYDNHVKIGSKFISVNTSGLHSSFNSTTNITLEGIDCSGYIIYYGTGVYNSAVEIKALNQACPGSICQNASCIGTSLAFVATHFTGYAAGPNTNLTIYDELEAGGTKYTLSAVSFYANYTNITNGAHISGASCNISFDDGTGPYAMADSGVSYNYTKNSGFAAGGTHTWNVTCAKSGFNTLNATDDIYITADAVPEFTTITLICSLALVIGSILLIRIRN